MRSKSQPDRFLSFAEVAQMIGLSVDSIWRGECGTSELARIKLGRRTLFSFNDVQAFMARRLRETRESQSRSQVADMELEAKLAKRLERKQFIDRVVIEMFGKGKRR